MVIDIWLMNMDTNENKHKQKTQNLLKMHSGGRKVIMPRHKIII